MMHVVVGGKGSRARRWKANRTMLARRPGLNEGTIAAAGVEEGNEMGPQGGIGPRGGGGIT